MPGPPSCVLGVMCGDLMCLNGASCLDDFLCVCPPGFTGLQCGSIASMFIIKVSSLVYRTVVVDAVPITMYAYCIY